MLIATKYEILRGLTPGNATHNLPRKPVRVATIINEQKFLNTGGAMIHLDTVFFEDYVHDWIWQSGLFRYYTRVAEKADVLIVYEERDARFCTHCGYRNPFHNKNCPHKGA
jgi:hypothetical protein